MDWQNGMQQGGSWYGGSAYSNYGPYGCPPGAGYPVPPPMPAHQGWGPYPPYGSYSYPQQGNWAYGVGVQTFLPSTTQSNDSKTTTTTPATSTPAPPPDISKINPPLPPDPPPGEPPKEEEKSKSNTEKDRKSTTEPASTKTTVSESNQTTTSNPPTPTFSVGTTNENSQTPPINTPTPPYPFDPSQFTMPPPTACYTMFPPPPPNNWYNNQGYMNQSFPSHLASGNASNSNSNQSGAKGPIKFNLPNKKGSFNLNSLTPNQSSKQDKDSEIENSIKASYNFFPQNVINSRPNMGDSGNNNSNNNNNNNSNNNNKRKRKKNNKPWMKDGNVYGSGDYTENTSNVAPSDNLPHPNQKKTAKSNASSLMSSGDWPESLKRYVGKCFARCVTELDKDQVEICLKGKLTLAARNETLWTKDWDQEPLISVHSVASVNEKTDSNDFSRSPKKVEGDPSRGFTIIRRSSHSRSRSRSPSPFPSEGRKRRDKRRHVSPDPEEKGFIGFNCRQVRGNPRGRGRRKHKVRNNADFKEQENAGAAFYTKGGAAMALDAELCTDERLQKRAARFAGNTPSPGRGRGAYHGGTNKKKKPLNLCLSINNAFSVDGDEIDWTSMHIVGTSTALEKEYLRLTSAPEPSTIRTSSTLVKSLEYVKKQWVKSHDYRYICNQLKSIRQDLTVQGIRDDFTVEVYETHCRVALEKGDHEEFNQCQSQLKELYTARGGVNRLEFAAYRMLYYIFTKNTLDMTSMLASLTEADKKDPCVSFALKLRAAWASFNYHKFFKLYQGAPKMAAFLVDWFAKRERERAIKVIIKSYRPGTLPANFVRSTLALSGEDWLAFVDEYKICFTDKTRQTIDCKQTAVVL